MGDGDDDRWRAGTEREGGMLTLHGGGVLVGGGWVEVLLESRGDWAGQRNQAISWW